MTTHRKARNWRGILAGTAGVLALALAGGVVLANPPEAGASAPTMSCAEALNAYQQADEQATADAKSREAADQAHDKAAKALAAYDATHGGVGKTEPPVDKGERAKLAADEQQTSLKLAETDAAARTSRGKANNARSAADTACQGPTGVEAIVKVKPLICARAVVAADTRKILKIIAYVPCPAPPEVPAPEAAPAPQPAPVETHLPVTH
jgi:hypothetical protein